MRGQGRVFRPKYGGLESQVAYVVRTIGKTRARQYLRELTDFEMVPRAEMFGV